MKKHVERMIKEHADLIIKTEKLNNFIYSNDGINIHTDIKNNTTQDQLLYNMTEYANKTMQLTAMKNYLKALECRLNNEGVFFENVYIVRYQFHRVDLVALAGKMMAVAPGSGTDLQNSHARPKIFLNIAHSGEIFHPAATGAKAVILVIAAIVLGE